MDKNNRLDKYSYALPERLIAQVPLCDRSQSRLLVVNRYEGSIRHGMFYDLHKYLPPQTVLVRNNSKVIPARLLGVKERSGGKVEIFLLNKKPDGMTYEALMRPLKKIHNGDKIAFQGSTLRATVVDKEKKIVRFNRKNVIRYLERIGHIPLPPYIKREDRRSDHEDYQTVYAKHAGSVAAPTAGLHFTKQALYVLRSLGHQIKDVTLHVNYATFKPVEESDISQHKMHTERYSIGQGVWEDVKSAKRRHRKILAIGTTSCRVLETIASTGRIRGKTDLFIYPGYTFRMVDMLLTNFHLPCSSLLMLVYAFGTPALIRKAYREAIRKGYRFFSYGDAMLII